MKHPIFDTDARHQNWQSLSKLSGNLPSAYQYWINLPGSLTKALKARTSEFNVEVLDQHYLNITRSNTDSHNQFEPGQYFSRKVLLKHGNTPWVFAHTLIPETSLKNGLGQLTALEQTPLGEILFSKPDIKKNAVKVCKIDIGWGRQNCYWLNDQPLFVCEFFLPDLIDYETRRTTTLY